MRAARRATVTAVASILLLAGLAARADAAPDTTPPVIDSTGGSASVIRMSVAGTQVDFTWSGHDDAGPPTFSVQVRDSAAADPDWQPVSGAQDTTDTSTSYLAASQARVCFRVRASDAAGNLSPWSAARCTRLDAFRPTMADGHNPTTPLILHGLGVQHPVYRFRGSDDVSISSYDVRRRSAAPGHRLGPWAKVAATTSRHLAVAVRPGAERCFTARAVDHVGRVSAYGDPWCVVAPVDDRALATRGGVRGHAKGALGGTVTVLKQGHDALTRPRLVGRELWIRARTFSTGCPHVWWGGQQVIRNRCGVAGDGRFSWYFVILPHTHRGTVRITPLMPGDRTVVDAVAVVR
jgi:hypothetical protein